MDPFFSATSSECERDLASPLTTPCRLAGSSAILARVSLDGDCDGVGAETGTAWVSVTLRLFFGRGGYKNRLLAKVSFYIMGA